MQVGTPQLKQRNDVPFRDTTALQCLHTGLNAMQELATIAPKDGVQEQPYPIENAVFLKTVAEALTRRGGRPFLRAPLLYADYVSRPADVAPAAALDGTKASKRRHDSHGSPARKHYHAASNAKC